MYMISDFNLQRLDLTNNTFSGNIPGSLGNLSLMIELYLTSNEFSGTIPSSLGNCKKLIRLNLDQNNLTGEIPGQLFEISLLSISLNLGDNQLSGQLPVEVGNLKNLNEMILANNRLTGSIPSSLGSCSSLQNLDISFNLFSGSFPSSLGSLRALEFLDASHNNFTGEIPTFLEVIPLKNLNISFNNLEGQVSRKGVFANASSVSILGNSGLCGGVPELQLPKCRSNKKKNKLSLAVILVISFGSVLLFVVMVVFFACYPWKKKVDRRRSTKDCFMGVPKSGFV
ncbi:putative non-specific serine/threonine protein kinase [Helianthus debilis subsp. tardiflorus]